MPVFRLDLMFTFDSCDGARAGRIYRLEMTVAAGLSRVSSILMPYSGS